MYTKSCCTLFSSVQLLSHVWLFVTPCTAACQASLSITNSQSWLKLMSIESVMPSTISSSIIPFPSCPQSFPALGSFPVSQLFVSGGQSTGVSASSSVLPMNIQDWFPLGWTGWISLQSKRLSSVFSNTTIQKHQFFSAQFSSVAQIWLFSSPWTAAHQASLSITNSQSSLRLMSIESVMPSSHLILCRPLLLLPPIPPSIRVFSNESTLYICWPKYWSFNFSVTPSKENTGLISCRIDWLDLPAVQGTLKSRLQHHSSKASILRCSAFFTVQLSHPYMITGKTIALTRRTFVGQVMSLLLNMLSRLVITFLPRSKHILISWLQSPSAVILEPKKIKSDTVSTVSREI